MSLHIWLIVSHTPNIEIVPKSRVVALHGDDMLRAVTLRNCKTGEERMIETSFLFLYLGGGSEYSVGEGGRHRSRRGGLSCDRTRPEEVRRPDPIRAHR
jgi:thioredoxin reductase